MKSILLANIGNRNLLFKNEAIADYLTRKRKKYFKKKYESDFLTFTKYLYEHVETHKHLKINILNTLIEDKKNDIGKIILFTTQQKDGRKDQDTYLEGEILKKIIETEYNEITVELKTITCPVVDTNQLMQYYRNALKEIIRLNNDKKLILCDAGGTAQQKMALKVMTEFLLNPENFEFYYVSHTGNGKSELKKIDNLEYRRTITYEQVLSLIEIGDYFAANQLLKNIKVCSALTPCILFGHHRINSLYQDAGKIAKQLSPRKIFRNDILQYIISYFNNYSDKNIYNNYEKFSSFLSKDAYFILCETLEIVQFYRHCNNYSLTIFNTARFFEKYCQFVVTHLGYNVTSNYDGNVTQLIKDIPEKFPEINDFFNNNIRPGLPLLIMVSGTLNNEINQSLIKSFKKFNSYFTNNRNVDSLRNQYAHSGIGINENDYQGIRNLDEQLNEWYSIFGLPDKNQYMELNAIIEQIMSL